MSQELDYMHIRAWGAMLGSFGHYVRSQIELARHDEAPQDVLYYRTAEQMQRFEMDEHGDAHRVDDPGRYFHAASGRVWARYGAPHGNMPAATVEIMERYLRNLREHGSALGG